MIYCTFENPKFYEVIWLGKEQHYIAFTWRNKTYILTDYSQLRKGERYALCVSQDRYGVMATSEGNFAGDPFEIPEDRFQHIISIPQRTA